jgi:hypothetical protein
MAERSDRERVCSCLLLVVLFVMFSMLDMRQVASVSSEHEEQKRTVSVGKNVPDHFPVLVVSPSPKDGHPIPYVVYHSELPRYLKNHPNYSFMVPASQVEQLKNALRSYEYGSGFGGFDMTQHGSAQYFEVRSPEGEDYVNTGWYEAGKRTFVAKRYLSYFGPGVAMESLPIDLLCILGCIVGNIAASCLIVKLLTVILQRCKRRPQPDSIA